MQFHTCFILSRINVGKRLIMDGSFPLLLSMVKKGSRKPHWDRVWYVETIILVYYLLLFFFALRQLIADLSNQPKYTTKDRRRAKGCRMSDGSYQVVCLVLFS